MVSSSALETLAQFAIAQAGFASVVVVLRRGEDQLHPADRFRVFNALVPSVLAGFLALIPIWLELVGVPEPVIWRSVDILLGLSIGALSIHILRQLRRLPPESREVISSRVVGFNFATLWLAVAACLANGATSLLGPPQVGPYFFGLLALLEVGVVAFIRLVFVRPARDHRLRP